MIGNKKYASFKSIVHKNEFFESNFNVVLKSSILKCFVVINLFSDLSDKMKRFLPFGFGTTKILEIYCISQGVHSETAPDSRSSLIAIWRSLNSSNE